MKRMSTRAGVALASVATAAVSLAGGLAAAPAAQAATAGCPAASWCLFDNSGYNTELPTGSSSVGVLPSSYRDRASSIINNTGKRVCLFSYRGGGSRTMDLMVTVKPYQDIPNFALYKAGLNDTIDGYLSTTATSCPTTMAG